MTTAASATVPVSDKQEAILDAALHLFAARGFYGTTVPDIADRANVGAGTIYRYFENKEALVNALYQRHKEALFQALFDGFDPAAPTRQVFHGFWRRACAFARSKPIVLHFLELHHHAPYLDAASRKMEVQILETAYNYLKFASDQQLLKPLAPEVLLAIVWGAYRGLVQGDADGMLELDDEVVAEAEECVWEAIRR